MNKKDLNIGDKYLYIENSTIAIIELLDVHLDVFDAIIVNVINANVSNDNLYYLQYTQKTFRGLIKNLYKVGV